MSILLLLLLVVVVLVVFVFAVFWSGKDYWGWRKKGLCEMCFLGPWALTVEYMPKKKSYSEIKTTFL